MNSSSLERELHDRIEGEVRFDRVSRALYSTDASVYQIEPLGVVVVRSRDDVIRTVEAARRHGTSITARGGGTSQAGQAVGAGLQLDTSKYFNRILDVNAGERRARVEPGVVLDDLNAHLRGHGLRFAPDISTASRATIGGMIANNSSGARSVFYGKTIDHVLELELVMGDGQVAHLKPLGQTALDAACRGESLESLSYRTVRQLATDHREEIDRRFPKILRRVGGYNLDEFVDPSRPFNLSKIIVGSEGTLGLVIGATLNLVPLPAAKAVLAIEFDELLDGLAATPAILSHRPSAIEVMDRFILDHARENPALEALRRSIVEGNPGVLLCVELYADRQEELAPRLEAIERDLERSRVRCRWRRATSAADQARIWSFREAALGLSMAMKGDAKSLSFVEDTAVAPEKLSAYIDRFLQVVRRHGTSAGIYAHASVGCLHVRPIVDLKTKEGIDRFEAIASDIADLVLEFGGALSGEHGDGLVRGPFTEKMFGPALYEAFRTVKRTFDPEGIFNPGKIVDTPPLTANLRYGTGYRTADPATHFDFSEYGGMGRAAEMCSGLGVCRKKAEGTMCPSYMATLEEKHSTRGRANTLRLAMAGTLGGSGLSDEDVYEVLDLCLECRACRSECPVGVDVARLKSEFLAEYWKKNGVPRRAAAVGNIHALSKWGSRLAPASNRFLASRAARWLGEKLLQVDRRRSLPAWTADTFARRMARRPARSQAPGVVLFNDTFTNYCHPEIGMAAVDLFERAGVSARLLPNACCGRPLISQGLLNEARAAAEANAASLYDAARNGEPIVFLEPSCLSAVREDAPALLRGAMQRKALAVAERSILFEDHIERELEAGRIQLNMRPGPASILLHGHCHQKAMGLVASARALLSRIPSCTVVDLDAGCCGMAGSFGYALEHYEISRQIGERCLFPAARAMTGGAVLAASGFSCRQQVSHFTGVSAVHPAAILHALTGGAGETRR